MCVFMRVHLKIMELPLECQINKTTDILLQGMA